MGSWKIIWTASARRAAAAVAGGRLSCPRQRISPSLGGMMPATMRPSVDLPQPDSPTRPDDLARLDRRDRHASTACTVSASRFGPEHVRELLGKIEVARRSAWRRREASTSGDHAALRSPAGGSSASATGARCIERRFRVADRGRRTRQRARKAQPDGSVAAAAAPCRDLRAAARHAACSARHRLNRPDGVGMARTVEHIVGRPDLDDAAGIHHGDAVGEARHHAEIVGDPDQRHAELAAQLLHLARIWRLDRHVERRGRLVGDDQFRAGEAARWRSRRAGACRRRTGADRRAAARPATGCRPCRAHRARVRAPRLAADLVMRQHRLDHLRLDAAAPG